MGKVFSFILSGILLIGCADSETRSLVSSGDLVGNKFRRIAVFVEGSDPARGRPSAAVNPGNGEISVLVLIPEPSASVSMAEVEQKVVSSLSGAGVKASGGSGLFNGQTPDNQGKAAVLQKSFDAVLYVAVITNGRVSTRVEQASHNGQYLFRAGADPEPIDDTISGMFDLKSDGSVWRDVPTFQAKCDLQDIKTNKVVWSSETITTGGSLVLLSRASDQIVQKMRADGAI